ncbi:MAG: YciI family protein [Steroidobacteraceae bacterium]
MPLFAVIGLDNPTDALSTRNARLAGHRAYLKAHDDRMLLVGPFRDENGNSCGSLYVFEAEGPDEIQRWLSREPFFGSGIYATLHIRRFDPVMCRLPLRDWSGEATPAAAASAD